MKKLLSVLLIAVVAFTLVACGSSSPEVGKYKFTEAVMDGETIAAKDLQGMNITIELLDDGTGTWTQGGKAADITWADGKITFSGQEQEYELDGDNLVLKNGENKLIFERQ